MKLTISKEILSYGIGAVQSAAATRNTLPVLSNILLRTKENALELVATDMDLTISCLIKADVAEGGAITLPARKISQIINRLPTPSLNVATTENQQCRLESGSAKYNVFGIPAEDFPPITGAGEQNYFIINCLILKKMLERTCFAMSTEENRAVLNGLNFTVSGNTLTLVATDGRRMALCEYPVEACSGDIHCIVPSRAVNEIKKLLPAEGTVKVCWENNHAVFKIDGDKGSYIQLNTKLLEGVYPNWRQVVPANLKHTISMAREEFFRAMDRAACMTSEKNNSVKLSFSENQLKITVNSMEVGAGEEFMPIAYTGDPIIISFNPTFIIEPLRAMEDDTVFFEINDEFSPALLRAQENSKFVVMPIRTQSPE